MEWCTSVLEWYTLFVLFELLHTQCCVKCTIVRYSYHSVLNLDDSDLVGSWNAVNEMARLERLLQFENTLLCSASSMCVFVLRWSIFGVTRVGLYTCFNFIACEESVKICWRSNKLLWPGEIWKHSLEGRIHWIYFYHFPRTSATCQITNPYADSRCFE